MGDQVKVRRNFAEVIRGMADSVLPNGKPDDVRSFGSFIARTLLGTAAHHLANAIEVPQCAICREDAKQRKAEGNGDFLYACGEHGGGDGWELLKVDSTENPVK